MSRLTVLLALFLVNGCSLAFEVIASRKAATYLGATAQANAILLAAFLTGIGLGGWAAALGTPRTATRWAGCLLIAAGGLAAISAPAFSLLDDIGPSTLAARSIVLSMLVVPVGLAVGYSYPSLTALYAARSSLGRSVASTYAADTVGAAAGAAAAGLLVVPALGLRATGMLAGLGMASIGLLLISRTHSARVASSDASSGPKAAASSSLVLGLFFATGIAALILEVAWIRLFTLVIGTSTFSFSLTIAAFLAALGIGSQAMRSRVDRIKDPASALAHVLLLVGATASVLLLLSPVWERLYLASYNATRGIAFFQVALFLLALASILLPAGLMGAGFSLGVRLLSTGDASTAVGRLYGINTLGGVLGALLGGLVLIPSLGLRATILVASLTYIIVGGLLGSTRPSWGLRSLPGYVGALLVPALVWYLPEPRMYFAPYYHGLRLGSHQEFVAARAKERLLFQGFSPYGVTTVSEDSSYRYLRHNGRSEASNAPGDMSTQLLIGHLPLLMHAAPSRVLNIGLGAGFTLAAISHHPELEAIVQAELDPQIASAARKHFGDLNDRAMEDSRLELHVTDGRRFLASRSDQYDVIISEPSHLWVSGVSGLFTSEFYDLVKKRLKPDGIFATWVPDYEMSPEDIRIVAATLLDIFPNVVAFENGPSDIIFLASASPFRPSLRRVSEALAAHATTTDISRALEGFPLSAENLHDLLAQVAANADAMSKSVSADVPRNTDDWPVLEFHTAMAAISKRHETD